MNTRLKKNLTKLKTLDLSRFHSTLWIVKRSLNAGEASYAVTSVPTDANLQRKLANILQKAVESANQVEEYEYMSSEPDPEIALGLTVEETDFHAIAESIQSGSDAPQVEQAEELFDSWAYVIDLHDGRERVLGLHKISEGWKLKQKEKILSALFQNHMLLDYEEAQVFKLEKKIDCFAYDGALFILDKKKFEAALNFRVGMEKNRDVLLGELGTMGLVTSPDLIRDAVGNRLSLLRRLSMIKKNAYYRQPEFVERMKEVCSAKGWEIQFDGSKIVVTDGNVELILKLLNNDRLASMLNDEIFDVSAKKKVTG